MAKVEWVGNLYGLQEPLVMLGKFQSGDDQAIEKGELLELTADTNTRFVPLDSDYDMSGGDLAVSNEDIKAGDRAGYYEVIVPRPGDVFEIELAAASAIALATALYYSNSKKVTVTAGTNKIGHAVGQEHYPLKQGHLSDDAGPDRGETIKSTSYVRMTIEASNSYFSRLQQA